MELKRLATDFKDALFEGLRKYKQIENDDGTISFADVTSYQQKEGSYYTAKTVNDNHKIINEAFENLEKVAQDEDALRKSTENHSKDIEQIRGCIGDLSSLSTAEKSSVVSAVNELVKSLEKTVTSSVDYIIPVQEFAFTNKKCEIEDSRILSTSLVDVYFTTDTIDVAMDADISVESEDGKIVLTATIDPVSTIKGAMKVRIK